MVSTSRMDDSIPLIAVIYEFTNYLLLLWPSPFIFFFQAEDGIRDRTVTGVQTCALPISMTCLTRAINKETSIRAVGLCHEVVIMSWMVAIALGIPAEEVGFTITGVNH